MDFKKKPFNLFTLWIEAFKLANSTFGSLVLGCVLLALFYPVACVVLGFLGRLLFGQVLMMLGAFLMGLFMVYAGHCIFPCTVINLIAARANKEGTSLPQCFSRALLPAFYFLLSSILIWLASLITLFVFKLTNSALLSGLGVLASFFFITLPCAFTAQALALRGENPISAIKYSVDLVFNRYFTTAIMLLSIYILPAVAVLVCALALVIGIPLFGAESFDITHLTVGWYGVFLLVGVVWVFMLYCAFTAKTLLFLNLDYGYNRASFELEDAAILEQESVSTVLPVSAGMPVQAPTQDIIAPNAQVGMLKATVSSDDKHMQNATLQHLDQVYAPDNAKVQQYMHQEEDRMPTILFDDDMAAEMAKNQEILEKQKEHSAHKQQDNGPDNIKLSKR